MNIDYIEVNTLLEQFINHIKCIAEFIPTQIIGIKNLQSKYVYCSANYAKLLGYSVEHVVGQHGMFANDTDTSARIKEDSEIIRQKLPQAFLHIDKVNGVLTPLTFIKSPIIDHETNITIGILCQVFDFATMDPGQQLLQAYKQLYDKSIAKGNCPKLTKREKQAVFLFLANLNSQEIADVLYKMEGKKISKSTVDGLFTDQLFPKFDVFNRQSLYNKLISLGYNKLIPSEMLTARTIMFDMHKIY